MFFEKSEEESSSEPVAMCIAPCIITNQRGHHCIIFFLGTALLGGVATGVSLIVTAGKISLYSAATSVLSFGSLLGAGITYFATKTKKPLDLQEISVELLAENDSNSQVNDKNILSK